MVKLGRGGPAIRGVTPETDQYPSLAAGFRRRALFFEKLPSAKSEHRRTSPVISLSPLRSFEKDPGPYVSGTLGASDRNNHAYGISCRTRPIPIPSTRARCNSEQVPHGPSSLRPLHVTKFTKSEPINDGLGQKSGLILGRLIAVFTDDSANSARRPI